MTVLDLLGQQNLNLNSNFADSRVDGWFI